MIGKEMRQKLRAEFYDIDGDGLLVYLDSGIGRYKFPGHGLLVRLSEARTRLELSVRGDIVETFPLSSDPVQACRDASSAYFRRLAAEGRKSRRES